MAFVRFRLCAAMLTLIQKWKLIHLPIALLTKSTKPRNIGGNQLLALAALHLDRPFIQNEKVEVKHGRDSDHRNQPVGKKLSQHQEQCDENADHQQQIRERSQTKSQFGAF